MYNATPQIIEAVPNFSEGRRLEVIEAITSAIQAPEVLLLNRTYDHDHNRMVLTIAGPPTAVVEGLFQAVRVAADLIDINEHRGTHPRLGATDVVPLIPIRSITLEECALLATQLGERIGRELDLPVYLYEAAATRPERKNLADVRRGEYEALVQQMLEPHRTPDFGPAAVGNAGAVIVGARPFLIAYNFFLTTSDILIARQIAREIRESNGGLPAVKALGMLVNGQAQVSVNLVDYRITPLHVLMDTVMEMAKQMGVDVERSELIGLMPEEVMTQAAAHYLRLYEFRSDSIIEHAIRAASAQHLNLELLD